MNKKTIAILLNSIFILLEITGLIIYMYNNRYFNFSYYTQDSNLFALLVSILYLPLLIFNKKIPKIISILKYTATLSLTVTFLVVIFVLAPMFDFNYFYIMFYNELIYFHTLCPIIAFISFTFFESHQIEEKKDCIRATYFTIIYAIILITLNIINVVEGPYPFLRVQENPIWMSIIWFIVIVGGAYLLAKIMKKTKSRVERKLYDKR